MGQRGKGYGIAFLREHLNDSDGPCLIWPLSRNPNGYGMLGFERKSYWAHRFMCEMVHGPAPTTEYEAAHSCGKGHEGCVHPRHLSWKTPSQNALDSRKHGTHSGRNPWGWKGSLSRNQVAEMWSLKGRMTQDKIAAKFGVSASTVRDIYLGRSHAAMTVVAMLRKLSERELGDMKNYSSGLWSRRNLEAMIDDLVADTNRPFEEDLPPLRHKAAG